MEEGIEEFFVREGGYEDIVEDDVLEGSLGDGRREGGEEKGEVREGSWGIVSVGGVDSFEVEGIRSLGFEDEERSRFGDDSKEFEGRS